MNAERYQRVREAFHGAWQRPPGERTAFLDGICAGDPQLRREVEALLASAAQPDEFLDHPTALTAASAGLPAITDLSPPPATIGRYRVIRLLGQGGMGSAYEAQQENPARRVAIKTIRPGLGTPSMLRRFSHEAQILGRLRHPGIAQVHEAGVADGPVGPIPFIAMELIAGEPLDAWVQRHNPSRPTRIELLAKVCDAVQHAHQHGVIHRDLKPGNILVEIAPTGPAPKVLDFGVARLIDPEHAGQTRATLGTDPGTLIGTLAYMSPEQVAGDNGDGSGGGGGGVDARADVFALGVLLFELLTGRLPRATDGKPIAEAARVVRDEDAVRARTIDPSLKGDLDTICAKALEREPARRYQTAAELATDLRRFLGDEPIIARPATVTYQLRKFARRHKGLVAGLAIAALFLIAGVIGTLWYAVAAGRQSQRALKQEAQARWTSYKLSISAAQDGVTREPARTRAQLADAPQELRNWEWRHLAAALAPPALTVDCDPAVASSGRFTPDGSAQAAIARGGLVQVVDVDSGSVLNSFSAPAGLSGVVISAHGGVLATFQRSPGRVALHSLAPGPDGPQRSFDGANVLAIGLSPDGTLLGAVVERRGIFVLNTSTAEELWKYEFEVNTPGYNLVEFSADNRSLLCTAASTHVGNRITLYNLTGATPPRNVDEGFVAAFNDRDGLLASSTIAGIRLRDPLTLELRAEIHGQFREMTSLAFSGDGRRLVGFAQRSVINVWDVQTRELELAVGLPGQTRFVATSHAGDRVLACAPGRVTVLPLADCSTCVLRGHTNYVYSVAWSPDGATVASAGWDGTVRLWDGATGLPRGVLNAQPPSPLSPVDGIAFAHSDGRLLVLTHGGGLLEINPADVRGNSDAPTTPPPPTTPGQEAPHRFLALARPGSKVIRSGGGEESGTSADGSLLCEAQTDELVLRALATGAERQRLKIGRTLVYASAFSPDGSHLATSADDHIIRLWDLRNGELTAELRGHEGTVYTLAFSPDGSRLASGDAIGLIFLWDTEHHEKVAELRGHTSYVHSLAFSPDGNTLCSGSGDSTARLWLTSSGPSR